MHISPILLSRVEMRKERLALFLDLDGTLAPLAETPDAVHPDRVRTDLLASLVATLSGRVAILSGRTISDVDRILEASVSAVAGVHGLERRDSSGIVRRPDAPGSLDAVRVVLSDFAAGRPGLLLEDKGIAVALHYRRRPSDESDVVGLVERLAAATGMQLQLGHMVAEIRVPGPNKGDALSAFMAEAPFAGSIPLVFGDDLTDEAAFVRAGDFDGAGVLVGAGRPTAAAYRLAGIGETLAWLEAILGKEQGEGIQ